MNWEAQLSGPDEALKRLGRVLDAEALEVVERGGQYFMRGERLDALTSAGEVKAEADRMAALVSGMVAMRIGLIEPLRVDSVVAMQGDAQSTHHIFIEERVRASSFVEATLIRNDGTEEHRRPEVPMAEWMKIAFEHPSAEKALRLRAKGSLEWTDLYRLYEVVADAMAPTKVESLGCASKGKIGEFRHTANSVDALGDAARHGKERQQPPANPMSLGAARLMIDAIVAAWLKSLS